MLLEFIQIKPKLCMYAVKMKEYFTQEEVIIHLSVC